MSDDNIEKGVVEERQPLRYERECKQLSELALQQLNLPKNSVKGPFESLSFKEVFDLLEEEVDELSFEIRSQFNNKTLNLDKAILELGDVTAVLVGLKAKINIIQSSRQMESERNK